MREVGEKKGIPWVNAIQIEEDCPIVPTSTGDLMELRCVTAVLRHGDRTPKQKMKMEIRHSKFFEIFEKYGGYGKGNVKLKHPTQLQEILDLTRFLLKEIDNGGVHADNIEEKRGKLLQMVVVLELYGHFSGVYRKCILRFPKSSNSGGSAPASMTSSTTCFSSLTSSSSQNQDCSHSLSFSPSSSTVQFSSGATHGRRGGSVKGALISSSEEDAYASRDDDDRPRLELVLKWGGELTPAGRIQAEELGRAFRRLYPDTISTREDPDSESEREEEEEELNVFPEDETRTTKPILVKDPRPRRASFPKTASVSSKDSDKAEDQDDSSNSSYKRNLSTPTRQHHRWISRSVRVTLNAILQPTVQSLSVRSPQLIRCD